MIEAKLEQISNQITDLKLDILKREDQMETRIQLLEEWKKRAEQVAERGPRNSYYKWAIVASWAGIILAAIALIFHI